MKMRTATHNSIAKFSDAKGPFFSQPHSFSEHLSSKETVFKAICAQTMGFTSSAEGLSLSAKCSSCLDQLLTGTHMCVAKVATVKHQGLGLSLTLVLLTVKHMTYPQKASEHAEVNTKAGGEEAIHAIAQ